ncbi:MAG TPA: hypothetical protein PKZ32_21225, partial [Candidatus Melainabacteria bacterium]|nr:hypothetical protein [Candidatus Melainabacteria bacterium]
MKLVRLQKRFAHLPKFESPVSLFLSLTLSLTASTPILAAGIDPQMTTDKGTLVQGQSAEP